MHSRRWAAALLILFLAIPTFAAKKDDSEVAGLKAEIAALEAQVAELSTKIDAHFAALDKKLADIAAGPEQKETQARAMLGQVNQAIAQGNFDQAKTMMASMKKSYGTTKTYGSARALSQELDVIGKVAPADLGVDKWFQGETSLQEGKATLIVFWELWCPHCKREVPKMQTMYDEYKDQGLNVVGLTKLTRSSTEEGVSEFIKTQNVGYPMAKENGKTSSHFNVSGIPAAAVVKDGKIVWRGHPARITPAMLKDWL